MTMTVQHPRCPLCKGLLKYEPSDILGPERVKCILCGWEKAKPASAVKPIPAPDKPTPTPTPKPAPKPKQPPQIKFGTCPTCKRPDLNLTHSGSCGRCAYRLTKGIDLLLPSQPSGIAAPRKDTAPVQTIKTETKETCMAKFTPRGHCPVCGRDDVLMPGPKCSRCYDRISKGHDPKTNEPVTTQEAVTQLPPRPRPDRNKGRKSSASTRTYTIDLLQVLDDTWLTQRANIVRKLNESKGACSQLALAHCFVSRIESLGA